MLDLGVISGQTVQIEGSQQLKTLFSMVRDGLGRGKFNHAPKGYGT